MRILLTPKAERNYTSIREYIRRRWVNAASDAFHDRASKVVLLLSRHPEMGVLEVPEKGIRAFQLSALTRVFYRIKGDAIILLSFFDVRQHPRKKPQ